MTDHSPENDRTNSIALATSSVPYKILGRIAEANGIGVRGESTATTGTGIGVKGLTEAVGNASESPKGVQGVVPGNASGPSYGVHGVNRGSGNNDFDSLPVGVRGEATATTGPSRGVVGVVDTDDGRGRGVYGYATNNSGAADGLYGRADGNGHGVVADGDAQVFGSLDVSQTGASVYRSSGQNITESRTKIEYDTEVADDRGEYNDSNNYWFIPQDTGDYRVEAQIRWDKAPPEGAEVELEVRVEDFKGTVTTRARTVDYIGSMSSSTPTLRVIKTLKGLAFSDTVWITARHDDSGNTHNIQGGLADTYLTVTKVG